MTTYEPSQLTLFEGMESPQTEAPTLWPTPNTLDAMPGRTKEQLAAKKLNGHWGPRLNTGNLRDAVLMSSAAGSPARTSAWPARAPGWRASAAGYGQNTPVSLANYDRATSSWRTSQRCLLVGWQRFSETWPRSGTMRNGTAYRLKPLVPLTDATGSGSWPTPTANLYEVTDVEALLERRERVKARHVNGNGFGLTLQQAVAVKMWPTPASRDYRFPNAMPYSARGGGTKGEQLPNAAGGALNPNWVSALMGFAPDWTEVE